MQQPLETGAHKTRFEVRGPKSKEHEILGRASPMMSQETDLFSSIPARRFSPRAFLASLSLHCLILALLIVLPLAFTPELQYRIIGITPPLRLPQIVSKSPARPESQVIRIPLFFASPNVPKPLSVKEARAKPEQPPSAKKTVEPEPQASAVDPVPTPMPRPAPPLPVPTPEVNLGVFPGGAQGVTQVRKLRELEASGFGDHAEAASRSNTRSEAAITGMFDTPAGSDSRMGISRLNREAVVGSGFASNIVSGGAIGHSRAGESGGSVREGGFGDHRAPVHATPTRPKPVRENLLAAEILSKPKPSYSKEARELRLEGEVVLEVLLAASGDARVLRVIRGLGHGLDEAAVRAAEQIRFKPAEREGKPVDSRSVVQITFRLT